MDEGGFWKNFGILMDENERLKKENKELEKENKELRKRIEILTDDDDELYDASAAVIIGRVM